MHNALKMCCASSAIASLEHFNIMSHVVAPRRHTLLIYITLTLLSVMGVACGTIRPNDNYDTSGMPTRTTRTPEDVWGHGKKTKREQPRQSTPPRDDNLEGMTTARFIMKSRAGWARHITMACTPSKRAPTALVSLWKFTLLSTT